MKIAIIGSGISGLGAAYLLHAHHDITLYEKNATLGGHSRTIEVPTDAGKLPVDTGFIVFNNRNYPHLSALFAHLDVPVIPTDMSFGASIEGGWLEYGTQHLTDMFAQKRNLLRPPFWRMIRDILRFNTQAKAYLQSDPSLTLGTCLDQLGMGEWFRRYYLLAMGGAIWSMPLSQMLDFPASTFIRFFDNHGLLSVNDQPQWFTVQGGSREYIRRLIRPFATSIRTNCAVTQATRNADGLAVTDANGNTEQYDQIIMACHSDQALGLLNAPTDDERRLLTACRYQPNEVVVHSDVSFMPKHQRAWASWVYISDQRHDSSAHMCLSYWMNQLQSLPTATPVIVTLNPNRPPRADLVHDRHRFEHPVFDAPAIRAQAELDTIQGTNGIWYCGAWQRYGFHEDGLMSAVNIAAKLGITPPWK